MSATVINLDAYRDDVRLSVLAECMELEATALRCAALLIEKRPTAGTIKVAVDQIDAIDALVKLARVKLGRLA